MGLIFQETPATPGDDEIVAQHELDVTVKMSKTTDGGLEFGASFGLAADADAMEDSLVYISGAFGTLSMGNGVDEADAQGGIDDVGYDGTDVDNSAESLDGDSNFADGHNVSYSKTVGSVTFAASANIATAAGTPYAVGVKYDANGLKLGLGYNDDDAGSTVTSVYGEYASGPVTVKGMYSTRDAAVDRKAMGLSVSYKASDALTITVAGSDTDAANDQWDYGVGLAYSLGGGATLQAGIAQIDNGSGNAEYTKASVGIAMKF